MRLFRSLYDLVPSHIMSEESGCLIAESFCLMRTQPFHESDHACCAVLKKITLFCIHRLKLFRGLAEHFIEICASAFNDYPGLVTEEILHRLIGILFERELCDILNSCHHGFVALILGAALFADIIRSCVPECSITRIHLHASYPRVSMFKRSLSVFQGDGMIQTSVSALCLRLSNLNKRKCGCHFEIIVLYGIIVYAQIDIQERIG